MVVKNAGKMREVRGEVWVLQSSVGNKSGNFFFLPFPNFLPASRSAPLTCLETEHGPSVAGPLIVFSGTCTSTYLTQVIIEFTCSIINDLE